MEKYLGNKKSLLPLIEAFIGSRIPKATRLSDVFAGTNNVSRFFRSRGWSTAACDANRFSYVLAHGYLATTSRPAFEGIRMRTVENARLQRLRFEFARSWARFGQLYMPSEDADQAFQRLSNLADVLVSLQEIGEKTELPGVMTDCYTRWGNRAKYLSARKTAGTRNYFSRHNALFLDGVLETVRRWWRHGCLTRSEVFLLLTSILEEVVITANVNGTFHDFNRDRLWPNAKQAFRLRVPLISCSGKPAEIANADAVDAAEAFRRHDVCYLDPPYNFRQYTAYYHLLNFISAYPFLEDVQEYVSGLMFVRGQNPDDDFSSDFCHRDRFISSLRRLIQGVQAKHVVLSYYGGRNHWNHWAVTRELNDRGLQELRELFQDSTVFSHSEVIPALDLRQNYQSRVGEQKQIVKEYLFHGILKARYVRRDRTRSCVLAANVRWGLADEFRHRVPEAQDCCDGVVGAVG